MNEEISNALEENIVDEIDTKAAPILWKVQLFLILCTIPHFYGIYAYIPRNEFTVFLHYNIYFGIDKSGEWYQLFLLPASLCIILLFNTFFSYKSSSPVIHWLALTASLLALIVMSVALILIIQLNI